MTTRKNHMAGLAVASACLALSCARSASVVARPATPATIVFSSRDSTTASLQLYLIAPDGTGRTRVTRSSEYSYNMPVWSPDRRWIAAVRSRAQDRQGTDLVLVRPSDGTDSVVARFPGDAYFPDWSADGSRLVVLAGSSYPAWAAIIVTVATGELRELLPPDTAITRLMPTWTRDGHLLVAENAKCRTRVFRVDALSGRTTLVLETDSLWLSTPAESPDGRDILLTGSEQSPCTPAQARLPTLDQDVYVMNADGSELRRLTHDPMLSNTPRWAPNGNEIVFASDRHASGNDWVTFQDSTELYVMRRDGSEVRRLTRNQVPDLHPHW